MDNNNILKIADSFLDFLFVLENNIFKESDLLKKFQNNSDIMKAYFEECPMDPSHAKVILYLMTSNSSSISQIASNLGILKSNMTPIIDRLVEHGLVNKFPDPKDRRILRVELTDKAFKLFDAVKAILKESLVKKLSNLSEEELTLLDEHTLKLSEIVKKLG